MSITVDSIERGEGRSIVTLKVELGQLPGSGENLNMWTDGLAFAIPVDHSNFVGIISDSNLTRAAIAALLMTAKAIQDEAADMI